MAPIPAVLVAVGPDVHADPRVRNDLEDWVWGSGFRPRFAVDAAQAVTWLREERDAFAASLLDIGLGTQDLPTWRQVGPWVGRRLVLLLRERRRTAWFEALRSGAGAVVPHPWDGPVLAAALEVATGRGAGAGIAPGDPRRRPPGSRSS
jgi:DNA-binding response OmpR family regulator